MLGNLIQSLRRRGEQFLPLGMFAPETAPKSIGNWCDTLLSSAGEASGVAIAGVVLDYWRGLDEAGRAEFIDMLDARFGVDLDELDRAAGRYAEERSQLAAAAIHRAAEPRRQDLFRRLNLAPGGVAALVRMREELLRLQAVDPARHRTVDIDFVHLFSSWFNRGFLTLERIDWGTPARILEKVIRYEAVHEIRSWDDLRRRLEPEDRRCYAFFHPQLPEEPLIFVEVALTTDMPRAIAPLLAEDRETVPAAAATHAVFYSISNCQKGLLGISFGNFLIKQVVEELRRDVPGLTDFVTLSPVPRFAAWLRSKAADAVAEAPEAREIVAREDWPENPAALARLDRLVPVLAARYLLLARDKRGRILDPVARFHIGNGASLARINVFGDSSPGAIGAALGLMVNYRYRLEDVERNHEACLSEGSVAAAPAVRNLLDPRHSEADGSSRKLPHAISGRS